MADPQDESASEPPAPWRWYRDHNGDTCLRDAGGRPILLPVFTGTGMEIAASAPVRALTEAAPTLRDHLVWALNVIEKHLPLRHATHAAIRARVDEADALLTNLGVESDHG